MKITQFKPALLLPALFLMALPLQAQDPFAPRPIENKQPEKLTIQFEKARAGEIADYLQAKSSTPLSIIFADDSQSIELPSMRLKGVTVEEIIRLINQLGVINAEQGGPGYTIQAVDDLNAVYTFRLLQPERRMTPNQAVGKGKEPVPRIVLDLSGVLNETLTIDDVTTAIHAVWGTEPGAEGDDSLKFHVESNLLIVTAWPEKAAGATNVVKLLQDRAKAQKESEHAKAVSRLHEDIRRLEMEKSMVLMEMSKLREQESLQQQELKKRFAELEAQAKQK